MKVSSNFLGSGEDEKQIIPEIYGFGSCMHIDGRLSAFEEKWSGMSHNMLVANQSDVAITYMALNVVGKPLDVPLKSLMNRLLQVK